MPPTPKKPLKKELGTFQENNIFTVVKEYNTPKGKVYYSASSPDRSAANKIADFKHSTMASDSIPSNLIIKKKGGTVAAKKRK